MLFGLAVTHPAASGRPSSFLRPVRLISLLGLTCLFFTASIPAAAQTGQTGDWVWLNGSNQRNQNGNFGILQVPAPTNNPGGRSGMASWTDSAGNLWTFGGGNTYGYNDVWEFNSTTLLWTWMAGPDLPSQPGVYGTLGTASQSNAPGTRGGSVTWTGRDGNLWLFGGEGQDSIGHVGYLNDLWKFSPSTLEWTWMGGSNVLPTCPSTNSCGPSGVYGTLATPSASNIPTGRSDAMGWVDANGDFWLFGGRIYIVYLNGWAGYENDLWKYSPSTNEWAWMGGNSSLPSNCTLNDSCGWGGTYGTQLTPSTSNLPGAREDSTTWTDSNGDFWLFGGFGYDSAHIRGDLNDVWRFDPSTGAWEWVNGSDTVGATTYSGQSGSYGTRGTASAANHPGGRTVALGWIDQNNHLWVFGGDGFDATGNFGILGDLWEFNPSTNQWTWMTGSSAVSPSPSYGTFGIAGTGNDPGARLGAAVWSDQTRNLWIFGGTDITYGVFNDAWEYLLNGPPHAAPPSFTPAAGAYTGPQSITISGTDPNATIYYTTDGSVPSTSSAAYTGPVHVGHSQTINAIAVGSGYAQSPIASVKYTIIPATPVINWSTPTPLTYGTALSSAQLNATTSSPGSLTYNPPAGTVLTAGTNTLTATFTPAADSGYATGTASVSLFVSQAVPTVTWSTPAPIAYGTALSTAQLDASSPVAGTFVYSPPIGTVLDLGAQTLKATFTPIDTTDYLTANASVVLTVNQATPAITWPLPAAITYGTVLSAAQLNATSTTAGTFTYSPPAGTLLSAGQQTLTASFTPTDTKHYTTASASVVLTVNKATPTIAWSTPAPIIYPTALTAAQLNATASVPGTFVYSPPAGTTPSVGSDTLSATLTPADQANYQSATATVTILVEPQPAPAIASLSPPFVAAGGTAFTLTVNGSGFTPQSQVVLGATSLPTRFVNTTQITVQVPASAIANAGTTNVAVQNPAPGGGTSTFQFEVDSSGSAGGSTPSFATVTATVTPGSTASYPVTLPSSTTNVSVNCLNLPNGATCSYSAAAQAVTITTSSATPAGTYEVTVVFTETLPGAMPALGLVLVPILPFTFLLVRRSSAKSACLLALVVLAVSASLLGTGCGGGSSPTHNATSSAAVTLTIQ